MKHARLAISPNQPSRHGGWIQGNTKRGASTLETMSRTAKVMSLRPTSSHPSKSIAQKTGLHEKRAIRCAISNPKAPEPVRLADSRAAGVN